jgi:hypothetical protein
MLALGLCDHAIASGEKAHAEAGCFKMVAHEARNVGIVFHEKDVRFHAAIVIGESCCVLYCGSEGRMRTKTQVEEWRSRLSARSGLWGGDG